MRGRAFSVLEVVLALALLGVLSGAMGSFVYGVQDRREGLEREAARARAVGVVFERLNVSLRLAEARGVGDVGGVHGDAGGVSVVSRGVVPGGGSDLVRVECSGGEGAVSVRVSDAFEPGAEIGETVEADARRVRFRYHDGRAWRESFDSAEAGRLPVAVEVAVWFGRGARDRSGIEGLADEGTPDRLRVFAVGDAREGGGG